MRTGLHVTSIVPSICRTERNIGHRQNRVTVRDSGTVKREEVGAGGDWREERCGCGHTVQRLFVPGRGVFHVQFRCELIDGVQPCCTSVVPQEAPSGCADKKGDDGFGISLLQKKRCVAQSFCFVLRSYGLSLGLGYS